MAPKRQPPPQKPPSPPPAESSDDEETEEEGEDASENAEEQSESEASDEEQSGEDDSESEHDLPAPKPQPSAPAAASVDADLKARAVSSESKGDGAPPEGTPTVTSRKSLRRIWSDDDHLALLRGMVEFINLKGKDPITNMEEFSLFVQKSLSFPVTESQLMVKIRALRFKYRDNEGKGKVFVRASEEEAFELSRKIWGAEDKNGVAMAVNGGKAGSRKRTDFADNNGPRHINPDLAESCPVLTHEMVTLCKQNVGLSENYVRARINAADESKVKLLEERWKKQKLEEADIFARKKTLEAEILRALMR